MMSEVLKACPFCGTAPERLKNLDFSDSAAFWHPEADCILSGCSIHRDKWQGWNTRAPAVATDEGVVERVSRAILDTAQRFDWTNIGPFEAEEFARAAISAMAHQP